MKTFDDYLSEYDGNHEAASRAIHADLAKFGKQNAAYRTKNAVLTTQVGDLTARVPADGMTVIPQADSDLLEQYRAFGAPDDIRTMRTENGAMKRGKLIGDVAKVAGLNGDALAQLDELLTLKSGAALEFDVRDRSDGKGREAVVKHSGKWLAVDAYFTEQHSTWMPSLKPATAPPKLRGTNWINQSRNKQSADPLTQQSIVEHKQARSGSLL